VGSRQGEDVVTAVAAAEVQGDGAHIVGLLEGRYGEAERGREGMGELGDGPVDEGVEGRELGANTREVRRSLPDGDVDVGETGLAEDVVLDVVGSGLGILEDDSHGLHADGHKERAERGLVSSVGPADAHDGGEPLPAFLEVCLDALDDPIPGGEDAMAVDGAKLANVWLCPGTALALGPGSACLVDKRKPADSAVGVGVGVVVCETGPFGVDVGLVELVELGGRREKRRGWQDRRLDFKLRRILVNGQTMLEE
jgi:hypothetical protein